MATNRINQVDEGFCKATATNLPVVDVSMVLDFLSHQVSNTFETRCWKLAHSTRENYGDNAIGYVQVKRLAKVVVVKAKITPEHRLREAAYSVSAQIDEDKQVFDYAKCHDCVASEGGCKHAVAFVMWLHRRSESPATTDIECYWKKSTLSRVKDQGTFLKLSEMCKPKNPLGVADDLGDKVLKSFLDSKPTDCQLYLHFSNEDPNEGSIHSLACEHPNTTFNKDASGFLLYAQKVLTNKLCQNIEEKSKGQSKSPFWYEMRYGRVTASKIFEVSRCNTPDGSLVNRILGLGSFKGNFATKRGIKLEGEVMKQLEIEKKQIFSTCGFLISQKYPFFGASPDAVNDIYVIEIKCPSKESTVSDYINSNGIINPKYFAQLQTQMYLAKRRKGFFCVADPSFETNSKITVAEVMINKPFCEEMLQKAKFFWERNVYPKVKQ